MRWCAGQWAVTPCRKGASYPAAKRHGGDSNGATNWKGCTLHKPNGDVTSGEERAAVPQGGVWAGRADGARRTFRAVKGLGVVLPWWTRATVAQSHRTRSAGTEPSRERGLWVTATCRRRSVTVTNAARQIG